MKALTTALQILWAALEEIFDEAPYVRFMIRTGLPNSPRTYAIFCRERDSIRARQGRCC
jgi:hypothetical protein